MRTESGRLFNRITDPQLKGRVADFQKGTWATLAKTGSRREPSWHLWMRMAWQPGLAGDQRGGNSTTLSQKLSMVRTVERNWSNSTGLVTKQFA